MADVYTKVGNVRWAVARLLGNLDAKLKLPDCTIDIPEIHARLEEILALVKEAHDDAL